MTHHRSLAWFAAAILIAATYMPSLSANAETFCFPYRGVNIDDPVFNSSVVTQMSRAQEAGIPYVRLWAWWNLMEPSQGSISFATLDSQIAAASAKGLKVLLVFVGIPAWANGSDPGCSFWSGECSAPPTNPKYFYDFVYATVIRYQGTVKHYEVWNEPNLSIFWNGDFTRFINEILINGSNAIRAADSQAQVIGPATYSSVSRFQTVLAQACSSLDILSLHEYPGNVTQLLNKIDGSYRSAMQATGCSKPLWVTEFGIDSLVVGEQQQATDYSGAFEGVDQRSYLDGMFIYRMKDHRPAEGLRYGLVESDVEGHQRKPSFWAVRDYSFAHPLTCIIIP